MRYRWKWSSSTLRSKRAKESPQGFQVPSLSEPGAAATLGPPVRTSYPEGHNNSRYIYNWGLAQSQEGYPGYQCLTKQLQILNASEDTIWLKETHSHMLQQAL